MTVTNSINPHPSTLGAFARGTLSHAAPSFPAASNGWSASAAAPTGLDRFRATVVPMQAGLTPVQQGEAARAADTTARTLAAGAAAAVAGAAVGGAAGAAAAGAMAGVPTPPHHPIQIGSTVVDQRGTRVTTVTVDVQANFQVDGGALPAGQTPEAQARLIERNIERAFTRTFNDPDGTVTRYVTDVHMTVSQPEAAGTMQFAYVAASDPRLDGALGMAPGFETGNVAYLSDGAGERTAPHEFGHLAGLRHTAQVDLGCVTEPGIDVENLMSQTGCSPTSQTVERSQFQQIFRTPAFR